jgi:hypothetical protein
LKFCSSSFGQTWNNTQQTRRFADGNNSKRGRRSVKQNQRLIPEPGLETLDRLQRKMRNENGTERHGAAQKTGE